MSPYWSSSIVYTFEFERNENSNEFLIGDDTSELIDKDQ